jgi:hypothetical protein
VREHRGGDKGSMPVNEFVESVAPAGRDGDRGEAG